MGQSKNNVSSKALKWIAGILATIISGVAVFWLTEGQGSNHSEGNGQIEEASQESYKRDTSASPSHLPSAQTQSPTIPSSDRLTTEDSLTPEAVKEQADKDLNCILENRRCFP
jgi:cytoskeletal protein RodZ